MNIIVKLIFIIILEINKISKSNVIKISINNTNCIEKLFCLLFPIEKNPASIDISLFFVLFLLKNNWINNKNIIIIQINNRNIISNYFFGKSGEGSRYHSKLTSVLVGIAAKNERIIIIVQITKIALKYFRFLFSKESYKKKISNSAVNILTIIGYNSDQ